MQGYPLKISAGNNPPRAFVYPNQNNEMIYSGIVPRLIKIFARHFNFTLQWMLVPNYQSSSLRDCMAFLLENKIDLCGDFMHFNDKLYAIAAPVFINYGYIQVPFSQTIPKYQYFLQPFENSLWYSICILLAVHTLVLSLIHRYKSNFWSLGKFFLLSLQSILFVSTYNLPPWRGHLKYFLYLLLTLTGFIISTLYVTFLSSILTTNVYEPQIDSVEELKQRKIPILTNDLDIEVLKYFDSLDKISGNYLNVDITTYGKHRSRLNPQYAYITFEDKCDFYLYQQKFLQRPRLRLMTKPSIALWANIPMHHNWPFLDLMHRYMLRIFETGLLTHIQELTKEEGIVLGHIRFLKTSNLDSLPLDIHYFEMPAILLGIGYCSALLCFIGEALIKLSDRFVYTGATARCFEGVLARCSLGDSAGCSAGVPDRCFGGASAICTVP
ncbi:uncharacterized protein LOC109614061 [Musca domestica]|uniref:Uncharacterized protein LOC109614061 n=1 Tax=Musca domestica TaxID=7370 RepID=A0A9J7DJ43_MUSDO|nr:uncharacterized protein LOC109614061 [Musca domestica]